MKANRILIKSLSIVVLLVSYAANADDASSGSCGGKCSWSFNSTTGELSITGEGPMQYNIWGNRPWKDYEKQIQSVYIGKDITSIAGRAFDNSSPLLNSVTFEEGSKLESIGYAAFHSCSNLKNIELPSGVKTLASTVFYGTGLTELILPDSITTIGKGIVGNTSVTELKLPDSVTKIDTNCAYDGSSTGGVCTELFLYTGSVKNFYCSKEKENLCRELYNYCTENNICKNMEVLTYTLKNGYYYDKDGKCYASFQNLLIGKDIKRIYTIEEASEAVKGNKNTFSIKYR